MAEPLASFDNPIDVTFEEEGEERDGREKFHLPQNDEDKENGTTDGETIGIGFDAATKEELNVNNPITMTSSTTNNKESNLKAKRMAKYKMGDDAQQLKVTFQEPIKDTDQHMTKEKFRFFDICIYDEIYIRKYWDGRIKLAEVVASALATVLLSYDYEFYHSRFVFSRVLSAVVFLVTTIELLLHLFSLWHYLPHLITKPGFHMFFDGIAAICFAVSSGLIMTIAKVTGNEIMNLLSGFCGIVCMLLFAVETLLHVMRYVNSNPLENPNRDY